MSEERSISPGAAGGSQEAAVAGPKAIARRAGGGGVERTPGVAEELHAFLISLLEVQCTLVGGLAGLVYLLGSAGRRPGVAATFLPTATGEARNGSRGATGSKDAGARAAIEDPSLIATLQRVAAAAAENPARAEAPETLSLAGASDVYHAEPTHRVLTCPLVIGGQAHGATAILVPFRSPVPPAEALTRLRLTVARYEAFIWQQHALGEAHAKTRLRETLELLDAAQQGEDAGSMGSLFCHELARRFSCSRVSIGLVRGDRIRLASISSTDDPDARGAAAEFLEAAMEETADQDTEVVYPPPAEMEADPAQRRVVRAHQDLSERFGPSAILSLPLRVQGDVVGVLTLERSVTDPFPPGAIPLMRLVAEFIGPAVWTRRLADRRVLGVVRDRTYELARATVGPRHTGLKALVMLILLVLAALAFVPIPGRVLAPAEIEASVSRIVPPPFTGILGEVLKRPGDSVEAGEPLARMRTEDIELELAKERTALDRMQVERSQARSEGRLSDVARAEAAIGESLAKIALWQRRLDLATVVAPIGGLVARGDVQVLEDAQVDPSSPLFELIDPESLIVTIQVDERDIGRVAVDQEGWLTLAARPDARIPLRVRRIRPMAEMSEAGNVYNVEAELTAEDAAQVSRLRPGLTGNVHLKDGWTTGLATLMRPVVDELRLRLWW